MADKTGISWTDATWNPVTGCTKVSPGCAHCYAEAVDHRYDHDKVGKLSWAVPASQGGRGVTLHPERLEQPLKWRKPRKIFVNSMSDLFHEDVPDEFLPRVFGVMAAAPQHTFQILTKRPERMQRVLDDYVFADAVEADTRLWHGGDTIQWPLRNVWLGVSVENQHWADIRIPLVVETPAAVRFVSYEPALKAVDIGNWMEAKSGINPLDAPDPVEAQRVLSLAGTAMLDWIIVGGESGPRARPMDPEWARLVRDQCVAAGVAFFFKQFGGARPGGEALLDGREWHEFPKVAEAVTA